MLSLKKPVDCGFIVQQFSLFHVFSSSIVATTSFVPQDLHQSIALAKWQKRSYSYERTAVEDAQAVFH